MLCRCPGKEEPRENTQRAVTAVAEEPTRFTEHGSEAHDRNIPLCFCKFLYHLKPKADSPILSKAAVKAGPSFYTA